jgi:hydroxymethylglutaryl-CoA lyase
MIKIIESPREGMQSLAHVIPYRRKIEYLNALLKVGFDTVELGSIVSPKLIPQLADSVEVIEHLDYSGTKSNRMILTVNRKGAEIAAGLSGITHISYPFAISPTFLKLNLNTTIEQSFDTVKAIKEICDKSGKQMVIYISMAYGNPYGDPWSLELLTEWIGMLAENGVRIIPLSNVAIEIGQVQINKEWLGNLQEAWDRGCRRFDSVINGYGGCPMSGEEMLGNLKTENLLDFSDRIKQPPDLDKDALSLAYRLVPGAFEPLALS